MGEGVAVYWTYSPEFKNGLNSFMSMPTSLFIINNSKIYKKMVIKFYKNFLKKIQCIFITMHIISIKLVKKIKIITIIIIIMITKKNENIEITETI